MKGPRGFAYACLPSRALLTPQSKRFQQKISQTKRMLNNYICAAKNESSLFKFSNAANLFQNLFIEYRGIEFDNQIWATVLLTIYMATLFIAYRPKSESANPFQIPIIDSTCALA